MGKLGWGAALWLFFGPAGPAWAEDALFAPRTQAEPPRAEAAPPAQDFGAADRAAAPAGFFAPEIKAEGRGRRTIISRGGEGREAGPEKPAPATRRTVAVDGNRGAAASEKTYRAANARREARPYFQAEEKAREAPYWQMREDRDDRDDTPYWQVREATGEAAGDRPYWEPEPERVEIIAARPSAVAPPPAPEPAGVPRTISYFMYQDEFGLKHLSNVPVDPRYREFNVTIRLQRSLAGAKAGQSRFTHENLRPIILRAAVAYNLDPALIAAVIKSESAFDVHAVSWAGAQGLMQLMPATALEMECDDPFDPAQNIMAGSRYLRLMLDTFGGDLTLAIASYNCGPERVSRLWRVPDIPETKNYVLIVSRNYERYKGQF